MHELKFDKALTAAGKPCFYLVARQLVLLHGSGMNWLQTSCQISNLMWWFKLSMRQLHDAWERTNENHPEYLLKTVSGVLCSSMNLICSLFALTEKTFLTNLFKLKLPEEILRQMFNFVHQIVVNLRWERSWLFLSCTLLQTQPFLLSFLFST